MIEIEEIDIFDRVKGTMGITTEDEDVIKKIKLHINAVVDYAINGGATVKSIKSCVGIGCVACGVNDLLNNKAGETKFSPAFNLLLQQVVRG